MRKNRNMFKIILSIALIAGLTINTFSAVVSDNDGSAFITKAEFDSLKNNFQSQLDSYNSNIDSKIDAAIASYLAGIKVSKVEYALVTSPGVWECVRDRVNENDYTWRYKYGSPRIDLTFHLNGTPGNSGWTNGLITLGGYYSAPAFDASKHTIHKLAITNLSETSKVAEWVGIAYGCDDYITSLQANFGSYLLVSADVNMYLSYFRPGYEIYKSNSHIGQRFVQFAFGGDSTGQSLQTEMGTKISSVEQNWGTIKNKNIIILNGSKPYKNFALYPNQRNFGFYTTDTTDPASYEKLWQTLTGGGQNLDSQIKNCYGGSSNKFDYFASSDGGSKNWTRGKSLGLVGRFGGGGRNDSYGNVASHMYCAWPCLGFEESYITDWNQLYTSLFDKVANDKVYTDTEKWNYFLRDDSFNYHVGTYNGVPVAKIPKKDAEVTFEINLINKSYDINTGDESSSDPTSACFVWISEKPFTGWPNLDECVDFTPINDTCTKTTITNYDKAIMIPASQKGKAKVKFKTTGDNNYIWVKWTTSGDSGGGAIVLPNEIQYTNDV